MQQLKRAVLRASVAGGLALLVGQGCAGVKGTGDDGGRATGGAGTGGQAGGATGAGGVSTGAAGMSGGDGGGGANGGTDGGGSGGLDGGAMGDDGGVLLPTGVHVQYRCNDTNAGPATSVSINMVIRNAGFVPVDLETFTLRYWLTTDSAPLLTARCETIQPGQVLSCAQLTLKIVPVVPPRNGADAYMEISFAQGGIGYMGAITQLTLRLAAEAPGFMQGNDYSFDPTVTTLADYRKITAYVGDTLLWGNEP